VISPSASPRSKPLPSIAAWAFVWLAASIAAFLAVNPYDAAFGAVFAGLVLLITAADLDRYEIPDIWSGALFTLGVVWLAVGPGGGFDATLDGLFRAGAAGGFLLLVRALYRLFRGFDGLGLGDVKLAAAGAPWISWPNLPISLLVAACGAVLAVLMRQVVFRSASKLDAVVPFGAFLAPALWITWLITLLGW
jgi:leader peptidase (prepilin peptidase) / N-methyltransferase